MAERAFTVEDVKKLIGIEGKPLSLEISKWMIQKFVRAVRDDNPLWQDEEYAKKTKYGGIIAPPSLLLAVIFSGSGTRPDVPLPYPRVLDGGIETEIYLPVRPGDVITSVTKFVDLKEREGKMGKILFLIFETTHTNQKGELVAKTRSTLINLE